MKNNPLYKLMNPGSIAIAGAGNNPRKMGTLHALNILKGGYGGKFFPLHPTEETVLGHKAYRTVDQLPQVPELVMLIVPTDAALHLLDEFGRLGTRRAIVVTSGFRETGAAGQKKEEELQEIARRHNIRFLGPNCIGMMNSQISLNTTVMPLSGQPGRLGMASQSGTYVTQTFSYLKERGIHFSKAISVGNETDIDITDALEYLGQDEETKAIALYIEGIKDGARFIDVAQKITPHKPVIAQYVGGSAAGARAGMSHTGSMAGPDFLYEGIFKQAGIIRVDTVEDLYLNGWMLASQPPMRGSRVGVVTNSGGPGTAISDTCDKNNLEVPRFSPQLQEQIRQLIQAQASSTNPVDLTFDLNARNLSVVIPELIMQSGEVDGLVLHGAMSHGFLRAIHPYLQEMLGGISLEGFLAQFPVDFTDMVSLPVKYQLPMAVSSFFGNEDNYTAAFRSHSIPVFDAPEKAAKAMSALHRHKEIRERKEIERTPLPALAVEAEKIIAEAVAAGRQVLDEYQAKQVLAAYGIPVTRERLAHCAQEAAEAAQKLGFPVVLKASSPDIAHKTEQGLVHLNLKTVDDVKQAYSAVIAAAGSQVPVLVAEMVQGQRELLAGMSRFPGFGPCIMFGIGGIFTEAIKDVTFRAAPLTETEAEEMLTDIRTAALLQQFRGMPAAETAELARLLRKLGELALLHPRIAEIDINPIVLSGSRPVAVDALIVLTKE
ncbi:acetate--CoA ligase family protein [Dethiobacter alkaliphilus]|uniref:CoA-binding domain protein n=1 Tax=Dethiobacter alkaliphilus AHT 1 TaxID=555088 RepID=C0GIF8_DETAL|nr:acetate--CoA ligase family protein [Dethiobacter alkaliphilus]EEG76819.1 CoA-binding domain protein [Dethiobacter alkaliphilus AHT 1]